MKDSMTSLHSYDYEVEEEKEEDDDAEIHFMISNEDLNWLGLRSRRSLQRFANHQNQIVRAVK